MDADEHFETAKKIASKNMASPNYTCSTLFEDQHDYSIKSYIIDLLIKENESTFWSCKLAIIEKQKKIEKINSFDQDDQATYFDLIQELKADLELLDRDIKTYYSRMRAINRQLKKLIKK